MVKRKRIPVLLLTGFLGSGKTSLLARWLRAPEFEGAMVIVNELGEVGLDDRLVATSNDIPLLLDNGCACCTANEDLISTLEKLFWDRLQRVIPQFNWVLIETTGIADPAPILASIRANDLISERYEVAGVVTTFDARRGPSQLEKHGESLSQAMGADVIILTKCDIATSAELDAARAAVRHVRPNVRLIESAAADAPASALLAALNLEIGNKNGRPGAHEHAHEFLEPTDRGHEHHHAHGHAHHSATPDDGGVSAYFLPLPEAISPHVLDAALAALDATFGDALLRCKGALVAADGIVDIVQAEPGRPVERTPYKLAKTEAESIRLGLTLIARHTPAEAIADYLAACIAREGRDTSGQWSSQVL